MMAAMNVTALADLGYDEKTTFIDPMEKRYRAKGFADSDFTGRSGDFTDKSIEDKVKFFNDLDAYRNVNAVESRLEAYWKTASSGSGSATTSGSASAATGSTLATSASSGAAVTPSAGASGSASSSAAASTSAAAVSTPVRVATTTTKVEDKPKTTAKTTAKTTTTKKR